MIKLIKNLTTLFFVFTIYVYRVSGQNNDPNVNFSGNRVSFNQFVDELEQQAEVKFYYQVGWTDTVFISGNFKDVALTRVLETVLTPYHLFFYLDPYHNVIITRNEKINESIVQEFVVQSSEKNKSDEELDISDKYFTRKVEVEGETIVIGSATADNGSVSTITGYVKDAENGEPLTGATIYVEEIKTGTVADVEGYYILHLKPGTYKITYKTFGMKEVTKIVVLNADGQLNINLSKEMVSLKEVVVTENKYNNIRGTQIGLEKLNMKEIKELPLAVGESDILKASLMLPGIQSVGESAAGYNVRGGAADQNLFIINNVPVFNTSHMFGFFSTFNPEAIKDFKLFKSNIPVEYGGRISSVFDIRTKQGNTRNFTMKGGISPVTAKLSFEGPVVKDKGSFILGIRSTYSDWVLKQIPNPEIKNSDVYFNDVIANVSYEINNNNHITLFGYFSKDNYRLAPDINFNYENLGSSIIWKHIYSKKMYSNISAVFSNYHLKVQDNAIPANAYDFTHNVRYYEFNEAFTYSLNTNHEFKFGLSSILYKINPGEYKPTNPESNYRNQTFESENALESAIYAGDRYEINPKLSLEGGLRFTFFNYFGPKTVYSYENGFPLSESSVTDTNYYDKLESIKHYTGLDIRLSLRYLIDNLNSVKVGYSRIHQYLFLLTNTVAISPTDRWKLCDPFSKPIVGDQYNLGYYRNFDNSNLEASAEIYYKENKNMPDFKNGADLVKNEHIERDLLSGFGRNYGIEFMVKKNHGKLTGWANYVYSRSELKFNGNTVEETINYGSYYPANYDKPHNVNLVSNLRLNRRLSFSTNFTYSTGRPATYPVSRYNLNGHTVIDFSNRNAERLPDYWRVDFSINLEGNLERKKLAHSYWMLAIYNLTGRKNAYSVFFEQENGVVKGYKLSVYSVPVITLSYNFKLGNYASN
ncbi:MAG: TonB-dependent receptor [Bacteroidales bacterium]